MTTTTAVDALKYAAALLHQRHDWITDSIASQCCQYENGEYIDHESELEALTDTDREIRQLAALFGDPHRYSDGRVVRTVREIEPGVVTEHIWEPDPAAEQPRSWRGPLRHDPDEPSPGLFEVETDPIAQEIRVRTVRLA